MIHVPLEKGIQIVEMQRPNGTTYYEVSKNFRNSEQLPDGARFAGVTITDNTHVAVFSLEQPQIVTEMG